MLGCVREYIWLLSWMGADMRRALGYALVQTFSVSRFHVILSTRANTLVRGRACSASMNLSLFASHPLF